MTAPHASPKIPIVGERNRTPKIMPSQYMVGARAGHRNTWWAFNSPITRPLTPKIAGEISKMRSRLVVSACCCGSNFGASRFPTIQGAKMAASRLKIDKSRNTRLAIADDKNQAFLRSPFAKKSVTVGTKADASAPPAIRLNNRSGKVAAALNASMTSCVPNARETRTWRTRPTRLLNTKAAMTVAAARAIWRLAEEV